MTVSLTGLILATSLIPMPKAINLHDGTVATGAVKIVELKDSTIVSEGYRIKIDEKGVAISASDAAGAFYARVTLDQLVKDGHLPCCEIEDAPKFRWRGVMLDEGRHFFGKEAVKNLLDNMAKYKLNVFLYFQARFGKDSNRNGKLGVSARCRIMQKTPSSGKLERVFYCR